MGLHKDLAGDNLHEPFHTVASADPGAVGAGQYWLDTTSEPYVLKRRNGTDTGWIVVGATGGDAQAVTMGFHVPGTLTAGAKPARLIVPYAVTVTSVAATVGTAPTGASLIVDVHKNGTTIFTNQANRPTIVAAGQDDFASTPDVTALAQDDILTLEIDQIGSTVAGADLHVQIRGVKA